MLKKLVRYLCNSLFSIQHVNLRTLYIVLIKLRQRMNMNIYILIEFKWRLTLSQSRLSPA